MPKKSLSIIEYILTSPLVSWTWNGLSEFEYKPSLIEFRPTDKETARDMIAGRYLLAGKLVNVNSSSPFSVIEMNEQWQNRLNDFSWLRHFSNLSDISEREFAKILVLDWIGQNKNYNNFSPVILSLRVLNWLRNFAMLKEEASKKELKIISRSLTSQLQSLKIRSKFMKTPVDKIYSAMALLAGSLSIKNNKKSISLRLNNLQKLLDEQIDADGLHLSRNSLLQFELLTELTSIKQTIIKQNYISQLQLDIFSKTLNSMYLALNSLTLGTGEIAYFNGAGHIPTDLFVALMAKNNKEPKKSKLLSGYGILSLGKANLVADVGRVPKLKFSENAHASALSFEFSYGSDLIVANCGAVPAFQPQSKEELNEYNYFRLGRAHNGVIINGDSSAIIKKFGFFANHLKANKTAKNLKNKISIKSDKNEENMSLTNYDFAKKFGIKLQRDFSLLEDERTLVGIDKIISTNDKTTSLEIELGFHLSPNSQIKNNDNNNIFYITLQSGAIWAFLWEGAKASIEKSYRLSSHFGPLPIDKIVLKSHFDNNQDKNKEISWIFTKQN